MKILMKKQIQRVLLGLLIYASLGPGASSLLAQETNVTARIEMNAASAETKGATPARELSNVVVWLTTADGRGLPKAGESNKAIPVIVQQNKSFSPHISVVQVGTAIQFPNRDRFLHNVFSLHDGKQFDLGFYEAGSTKTVRFDRAGVSYLFCNIHPEMTAAVVAVETPYFGISDGTGRLNIGGVSDGKYILHVWSERSLPEDLKKLQKEVTINAGSGNLGVIHMRENPDFTAAHKNKYGQDYVPPAGGEYDHP
jgi:plastocyanin